MKEASKGGDLLGKEARAGGDLLVKRISPRRWERRFTRHGSQTLLHILARAKRQGVELIQSHPKCQHLPCCLCGVNCICRVHGRTRVKSVWRHGRVETRACGDMRVETCQHASQDMRVQPCARTSLRA